MGELASVTAGTCGSISWRGRTLEARCLTATELTDWYLPLRYEVLRRELGWTVGDVRTPADLRDAYDRDSAAFGGIVAKTHLIGASRLVLSAGESDLPSVKLLRSLGRQPRIAFPAAEISRVMVRRDCRKLGVFPVLLLTALLLAQRAQVRTLMISERDDARFGRMMAAYGFERFADGFSFVDEMIAPDEPAVTYALDMHRFGKEARHALVARREMLLSTADGVFSAGLTGTTADSVCRGEQQRLPGVMIMRTMRDSETRVEHEPADLRGGEPMQG
jgi:predicted GNAT family N-acyltransferase